MEGRSPGRFGMERTNGPSRTSLEARPYVDFSYPRVVPEAAGGVWTPSPETFRVEEIPLYPFSGDGEHAAVRVEKRAVTTRALVRAVAQRLGVRPVDMGYAGMKDRACVAVQAFTVRGVDPEAARTAFEAEGCRVIVATRHRNKLRLGHLAGNRFRVFVHGTDPVRAAGVLERLSRIGVPNYFGPQRFGRRGDNAAKGLAVLRGRMRPGRWKRDLLVSALQSVVFNEVLARRIEGGVWLRALPGDVLRRQDSGGLFVCTDPSTDTARVERFEVSPTGPLPGRKMVRPAGEAHALERQVLNDYGLGEELFAREPGARRPLRAPVDVLGVHRADGGAWLEFACPGGTFATAVVREVTGTDAPVGPIGSACDRSST